MGPRLPAAAEESQDFRFCGGKILCADRAQRRDSHFLNDAVGHDRNRLDAFDVEQDNQAAITISRRDRQDPPALHARSE